MLEPTVVQYQAQDLYFQPQCHQSDELASSRACIWWQVVPKLEGVDELLNIPLDEECLQRLLSGDELDEDATAVRVPSLLYCPLFFRAALSFVTRMLGKIAVFLLLS